MPDIPAAEVEAVARKIDPLAWTAMTMNLGACEFATFQQGRRELSLERARAALSAAYALRAGREAAMREALRKIADVTTWPEKSTWRSDAEFRAAHILRLQEIARAALAAHDAAQPAAAPFHVTNIGQANGVLYDDGTVDVRGTVAEFPDPHDAPAPASESDPAETRPMPSELDATGLLASRTLANLAAAGRSVQSMRVKFWIMHDALTAAREEERATATAQPVPAPTSASESDRETANRLAVDYGDENLISGAASAILAALTAARADADRAATLRTARECAWIANNGCLEPPDGGEPTEAAREMCGQIALQIERRFGP